MLVEPRIICTCDHTVNTLSAEPARFSVVRSGLSDHDIVEDATYVAKVASVYELNDNGGAIYYEGFDFTISNPDKPVITWVESGNAPSASGIYYIECTDLIRNIEQFDIDSCPKCGGNGWYVSLFGDKGITVRKMTGINKMVQDFIKAIFTAKNDDGYGTDISKLSGQSIHGQDDMTNSILAVVRECEFQIKQAQLTNMNNGDNISDAEKLKSATVTLVEYNESDQGFVVEIVLKNEAGNTAGLNLKV